MAKFKVKEKRQQKLVRLYKRDNFPVNEPSGMMLALLWDAFSIAKQNGMEWELDNFLVIMRVALGAKVS